MSLNLTLKDFPICVCGAKNYDIVLDFTKDNRSGQIIRCKRCGLSRTWPVPLTDQNIDEFYKSQEDYHDRSSQLDLWRSFGRRILKILKKYKISGTLLDVGCNIGIFVDLAKKNGYDAIGTDLSLKAVELGKKTFDLADRLFDGKLEDLNFSDNKFDIITYLHVLEHIPLLKQELRKVYRLLKPGGLFLIEVPNFNSFWRKLLRQRWYALSPKQHFWQFDSASLKRLLKNHHFFVLNIDTRYNMYHHLSLSPLGLIKLVISSLSYIFRQGDNLIVIAKKI